MVTQQQASLNSQTYQWKSTCIQLKQPAQILVWICMKRCFHVHTNWQHKVKLKRSLSAAEVVQDGWSALFVAQLHKGGVISFRITQIKHTLTVQIDFLQWKRPFINNDFTAHCKMGYFYLTVGIKCFCQCTMKGINHLCILLSSQKEVLQSYVKNGCRPTSQLLFCFSYARSFTNTRKYTQTNTNNRCKQHRGPELDVERWGHECTHMCTDTGTGSSLGWESIMSCHRAHPPEP